MEENSEAAMRSFFQMRHVTREFGGITAVSDFSITVARGELMGLIGPNGAGKTTIFNMITGLLRPTAGDITWKGENITRLPSHLITARGIARTFQNIKLFTDMSVLENVMVSCHYSLDSSFLAAMLGLAKHRREEKRIREHSLKYLGEAGLGALAFEKAQNLPYGLQRKLEIARALATEPGMLLLDEPAAGMNPMEKMELAAFIRRIREKRGITIFLIEHDMKFVMNICERIKVINYGQSIAEGSPDEVRRNPEVISAYLGGASHAKG
jgi:branched-chain amino acid transport system ATP-binding protein